MSSFIHFLLACMTGHKNYDRQQTKHVKIFFLFQRYGPFCVTWHFLDCDVTLDKLKFLSCLQLFLFIGNQVLKWNQHIIYFISYILIRRLCLTWRHIPWENYDNPDHNFETAKVFDTLFFVKHEFISPFIFWRQCPFKPHAPTVSTMIYFCNSLIQIYLPLGKRSKNRSNKAKNRGVLGY